MTTIPVIVEEQEERRSGTLGGPRSGKAKTGVRNMDSGRLKESLSQLSKGAAEIFQDIKSVGDFQLTEVQMQAEITAEGGFALVGLAKAGMKGGITLKFRQNASQTTI